MKTVKAEYDASENVLRLVEPLEGIPDHAQVDVTFVEPGAAARSVEKLSGSLSKEAGESMARAINELFPPWD